MATGNRYAGGYSSDGLFTFVIASFVRIDGDGPDEPDATWAATYRDCSWADHAATYVVVTVNLQVYPTLPDKQVRFHVNFFESSIVDSVAARTETSSYNTFGRYATIMMPQGSFLVDRCRFERNGNFDPTAGGTGGIKAGAPPGGSLVPSWEFANSEWVSNS